MKRIRPNKKTYITIGILAILITVGLFLIRAKTRPVSSDAGSKSSSQSGSIENTIGLEDGSSIPLCRSIDKAALYDIFGSTVSYKKGLAESKSDKYKMSSCIVLSSKTGDKTMLSILERDYVDNETANKFYNSILENSPKKEEIKTSSDRRALLNESANQVSVFINKKIYTITITGQDRSATINSLEKIANKI